MNPKMKECFTLHTLVHTLIGLGIGMVAAGVLNHFGIRLLWSAILGVVIAVIAVLIDMMRKS